MLRIAAAGGCQAAERRDGAGARAVPALEHRAQPVGLVVDSHASKLGVVRLRLPRPGSTLLCALLSCGGGRGAARRERQLVAWQLAGRCLAAPGTQQASFRTRREALKLDWMCLYDEARGYSAVSEAVDQPKSDIVRQASGPQPALSCRLLAPPPAGAAIGPATTAPQAPYARARRHPRHLHSCSTAWRAPASSP